jgi:hypothetical protein
VRSGIEDSLAVLVHGIAQQSGLLQQPLRSLERIRERHFDRVEVARTGSHRITQEVIQLEIRRIPRGCARLDALHGRGHAQALRPLRARHGQLLVVPEWIAHPHLDGLGSLAVAVVAAALQVVTQQVRVGVGGLGSFGIDWCAQPLAPLDDLDRVSERIGKRYLSRFEPRGAPGSLDVVALECVGWRDFPQIRDPGDKAAVATSRARDYLSVVRNAGRVEQFDTREIESLVGAQDQLQGTHSAVRRPQERHLIAVGARRAPDDAITVARDVMGLAVGGTAREGTEPDHAAGCGPAERL